MDKAFERFNISHQDFLQGSKNSTKIYISYARQIQFVMGVLFGGVINYFASKRFGYPYTLGCFLLGVLVGILDLNSKFIRSFTDIAKINPSDLMLIFLPILIFESSFGMDPHMFSRAMAQCLTLALPGLVICTILTAFFAQVALVSYQFSWITAFLFGSIVSATDPVAVVALLKEMRMPHTFTILIEGESLLNDGVAIVMYETLSHFLYTHWTFSVSSIVMDLLKTCFGAPLFGFVTAIIAEWILNAIYISPVSEMSITLVIAYVTYFSAEHFLGVSAVLAVVLYGVTLNSNKMCISPESESLIQTDWRLLCTYANTLIFTVVGVLISLHLKTYITFMDMALIICTYIALNLIRGLMVLVCYPILKSTGYGLTWKEAVILVWGGLRGAVGLALALMFMTNRKVRKDVNTHKSSEKSP